MKGKIRYGTNLNFHSSLLPPAVCPQTLGAEIATVIKQSNHVNILVREKYRLIIVICSML